MGGGKCKLYHYTFGSNSSPGSAYFIAKDDNFYKFIRLRNDVDSNGFYDVIAHGESNNVFLEHNGNSVRLSHRDIAKMVSADKNYGGGAIRLLSCNTGKVPAGFAQNLANKLNVPVKAPTDYLWANPDGTYFVAGGKTFNGRLIPDRNKPGKFKTFYPQRRKKK